MPRIPVPDDYESGVVTVAGTDDYRYGAADVNTDAVERARNLSVREDDDGRYVGCSEHYADDVRTFLGVDVTDSGSGDEETTRETEDAEPESGTSDGEVCGAELSQGGTCDRLASECPYHDTGGDD
jgi:hypothetical protein